MCPPPITCAPYTMKLQLLEFSMPPIQQLSPLVWRIKRRVYSFTSQRHSKCLFPTRSCPVLPQIVFAEVPTRFPGSWYSLILNCQVVNQPQRRICKHRDSSSNILPRFRSNSPYYLYWASWKKRGSSPESSTWFWCFSLLPGKLMWAGELIAPSLSWPVCSKS
jgi:hypothetical protein